MVSIVPQTESAVPAKGPKAQISYALIEPMSAIADGIIITLASLAACLIYSFFLTDHAIAFSTHFGVGLMAGLFYVLCAYNFGLYRIQELFRQEPDNQRIIVSWLCAILILTLVLFILKVGSSVSRGSVVLFSAFGAFGLLIWRQQINRQLRRGLELGVIRGRRAIVLGNVDELARFSRGYLLAQFGIDEVERIGFSNYRGPDAALPIIDRTIERARDINVEEVILAFPWAPSAELELIRSRLRLLPLAASILPDRAVSGILSHDKSGALPLIEFQRVPLSKAERLIKRMLDLAIASIALALLAPLMALVAIAIKIESRGPVIFRQRRRGFNGKVFAIYKFRTMTVVEDGPTIVLVTKNDSRVTRVGHILRRTSIDEIPQLINVLRGDMSVVGPRPHALAVDDQYREMVASYAFRQHVIPGMSGWAQINGYRGETRSVDCIAKRVECDLWYINNWSIFLDLQILLRTTIEVFRRRNAY